MRGRLDPGHPGTPRVLAEYEALLSRIDPAKVLVPTDADWLAAGELAGRAARAIAGGGRKIMTAFDRVELITDALTAVVAREAGFTVVTEDADFDVLARLAPGLEVIFTIGKRAPVRRRVRLAIFVSSIRAAFGCGWEADGSEGARVGPDRTVSVMTVYA